MAPYCLWLRLRFVLGVVALSLLAGCTVSGLGSAPGPERVREVRWTGPFALQPPQRAWTAQPKALVLAARAAPGGRQQLIGLANETSLPGDNFLFLVAYGSPAKAPERLELAALRQRLGGVPTPFERLTDSALRRGRDSLGVYFFKTDTVGGADCVLALRRLDLGSRILPAGTAMMDVVLRNCAMGGTEAALSPMAPENLAVSGAPPPGSAAQKPRVFSPLAAPEL